ncbi:hypothetical protein ACRAKI_04615 [Saccharothrix isguenensis]
MPIRTNRGRAAVYRRLWGWPLRSPKHLAATIVGVIALITTISVVIPNAVNQRPAGQGATTSTTQAATGGGNQIGVLPSATATPLPTKAPSPVPAPPSVTADPTVQMIADMWVDAYASFEPGKTTKEEWLKGLKPYTSKEQFPRLESIAPENVPVVIVKAVKAVKSVAGSAEFEAELEDGKLFVTVVELPEGWRVHKFDRTGG